MSSCWGSCYAATKFIEGSSFSYKILEIKTFGLVSRIRDIQLWDEPNIELGVLKCALAIVFLPPTAYKSMEVKNNYSHVTIQVHNFEQNQ